MSIIVSLSLPTEDFVLHETFTAVPDAEFKSGRVVESGYDTVLPVVWVRGPSREELEAAFADDSSVEAFTMLAEFEHRWLYHMEWHHNVQLVVQMLTNSHATIMYLYGTAEGWTLRILYPSRDGLSRTREFCHEHGLTFDIETIREFDGDPGSQYGLTPEQFDALVAAREHGYFSVPREITLAELADEVGVTHQALSERLRRAHEALVDNTLLAEASDAGPESG